MMETDVKRYHISEWALFRSNFQRLLPYVPIVDLYDGLLSVLNGYLSLIWSL